MKMLIDPGFKEHIKSGRKTHLTYPVDTHQSFAMLGDSIELLDFKTLEWLMTVQINGVQQIRIQEIDDIYAWHDGFSSTDELVAYLGTTYSYRQTASIFWSIEFQLTKYPGRG